MLKGIGEEKCIVAGTTGVAAFNVGGETFHSLLGLSSDDKNKEATMSPTTLKKKQARFKGITHLFLDEVSMCSREQMAEMDIKLRQITANGIQSL